jgi:hypothetical protein
VFSGSGTFAVTILYVPVRGLPVSLCVSQLYELNMNQTSFIIIGSVYVIFGIMAIRHQRYGKEEGMWNLWKPFTGRFAVFLGIVLVAMGIILILTAILYQYM